MKNKIAYKISLKRNMITEWKPYSNQRKGGGLIMEKRYDVLGNEVQIGDDVIIIHPRYHTFVNGTITKFTPKGFKVKFYSWSTQQFDETFVGYGVIKGKMKNHD